jgi:2-phospho-L-lactate/phosphoenolpyruvate guanylyltransferase
VLVPVKSFDQAKERLAGVLGDEEREELVRSMATRVIAAAAPLPVSVVCEDREVAAFAEELGASVIWTPGTGLSGAVMAGVDALARGGFEVVTVAHGDLPLACELRSAGRDAGEGGEGEVTLVPDRRLDGTNVATVPTGAGFCFAYGPGSFERHRAEAYRLGLNCRVIHDSRLATDIDVPDDLELVRLRG